MSALAGLPRTLAAARGDAQARTPVVRTRGSPAHPGPKHGGPAREWRGRVLAVVAARKGARARPHSYRTTPILRRITLSVLPWPWASISTM